VLKASAIARQILEFSRRQNAEVRVVNFNTLTREIAEILRRVAGPAVKLELRLASDLGNVRIDPTQFQQVLLNLCFNAREAMPAGGKLTVRTANREVAPARSRRGPKLGQGYYAVMQVTDTGLGMEPGVLRRIFEPFFTTKPHGTGLGLSTVQGIIHQHNGHILAESTPGAGSTFEVFLPETSEPEQVNPDKLAGLPVTAGTETLLVIEEDLALRKMIAGILGSDGYRVTEVATPAEATAALAAGQPDPQLVLASGDAPAVATLVRALHAGNRDLRFICFSAQPPAEALVGLPGKAMIHLPKPFTLSTLMLKVRTLLDAAVR
jgi:CheY-like chemotaxis protein